MFLLGASPEIIYNKERIHVKQKAKEEHMKKLSVIALLSVVAFPALAEEAAKTTETVADKVSEVSESVKKPELSAAERAERRTALKEEIKAELKQEYATAKKELEQEEAKDEHGFLHGFQIGAGVSATSGLNGFVGYANKDAESFWGKRFGVRFDFATTKPIKSLISDGIDAVIDDGIDIGDDLTIVDGKIEATHYAALVDFYPFGNTWGLGAWRITGGYAFGDMNMDANIAGTFDGPANRYEFELAGHKYAYTGNSMNGTAKLDWEYRGPYLGTGFDIGLFAGFKIYVDAGVVFTNEAAKLSLDVPFENLQKLDGSTWKPVNSTELENEVNKYKAQAIAEAQDELDDFKFYPMVKVGFMYRF